MSGKKVFVLRRKKSNKEKRKLIDLKKIFTNYASDKGLEYKLQKQLNSKARQKKKKQQQQTHRTTQLKLGQKDRIKISLRKTYKCPVFVMIRPIALADLQ